PDAITRIMLSLDSSPPESSDCVVTILTGIPSKPSERKARIEEVLRQSLQQLQGLANPGALALLVPELSVEELDTYVDSINQKVDLDFNERNIAADKKHFDITNPFMVIARYLKVKWCGVTARETNLLNDLHEKRSLTFDEVRAHVDDDIYSNLRQHDDMF